MSCEEFRRRALSAEVNEDFSDWMVHQEACPLCAAWERRRQETEDVLAQTLLIEPPRELVAGLAQIPEMHAQTRISPRRAVNSGLFDVAVVFFVGLGLTGVIGVVYAALAGVTLPWLDNTTEALNLLMSTGLVSYAQGLAIIATRALATLVLAGLALAQLEPRGIVMRRQR